MGVNISGLVEWAIDIARDSSHGYDQYNHWGPDYDCASLIIMGYQIYGLGSEIANFRNKHGYSIDYVPNIISGFPLLGFVDLYGHVDLSVGGGLKAGDVLVTGAGNPNGHCALYCGNGKIVEALQSEAAPWITGQSGDQIQRGGNSGDRGEIEEIVYWRYRYNSNANTAAHWEHVFRYAGQTSFKCSPGVSEYKVSWGTDNTVTVGKNSPQDVSLSNSTFTISDIVLARVSKKPYVLSDTANTSVEFSDDAHTVPSYSGERTITLGAKPDLFTWGENDAMDSGNIITGSPINYITTDAWNHMLDLIIHACHIPPNQLLSLRVSANARFTAARYNQVGEILDKIHHALGLGTFFTGVNVNQPILPQHFNGQTSLKGGLNRIIQKYYTTSSTLNWSDIP